MAGSGAQRGWLPKLPPAVESGKLATVDELDPNMPSSIIADDPSGTWSDSWGDDGPKLELKDVIGVFGAGANLWITSHTFL